MIKLTFKQWYMIVVLIIIIVYGGLYLLENRYIIIEGTTAIFDTWTSTIKGAEQFLE